MKRNRSHLSPLVVAVVLVLLPLLAYPLLRSGPDPGLLSTPGATSSPVAQNAGETHVLSSSPVPPTATRSATPTRTPAVTAQPEAMKPDPTATRPATAVIAATATPEAVGTPLPATMVIPAEELPLLHHLWLQRPFAPNYQQTAESTYPYGSRGDGRLYLHTGVDIGNPPDTPVLAVADAKVFYAGSDEAHTFGPRPNFYGNLILLQLEHPGASGAVFALYGHLNQIHVQTGQMVHAGDVIGTVGMTGVAVGPHLHLEVREGGNDYMSTRNPAFWVAPLPGHGILAGRLLDERGDPLPAQWMWLYQKERTDRVWAMVPTYPTDEEINPDDAWQENFVLADVPAGEYILEASYRDHLVRVEVSIKPGEVTFVRLQPAIEESP